jgi:hypothetical protein
VPHIPQEEGFPVQEGSAPPAEVEANVENFFSSFLEPQAGQAVPFQWLDRTRISLSFLHS